MAEATHPLRQLILEELERTPGLKATELANNLGRERREINLCLSYELAGLVRQSSDYRWHLKQRDTPATSVAPAPTTEIARLCHYYLECISRNDFSIAPWWPPI